MDAALEIARRIADGEPVDWTAVEKDPVLASRLRGFRALEAVAAANREVVEEPRPAGGPTGGAAPPQAGGTPPGGPTPGHGVSESHRETVSTPGKERSPDVGGTLERWGHLRIRERIGRGGFGDVYRAHDPTLDREYALKLLPGDRASDPVEVSRFISEARRHARVSHSAIVAIHGADVHDGRAGLWMDLVRGQTLEQLLEIQGRLGAEEATQIGLEMCGALAAVHAEGLVHRDVKTNNIMRREGGGYVLLDFSASVERPDRGALAGSAPATGTPLFMAPEIFEGTPAGPEADIYSLGVVLYRLVSGRFPVTASDITELREKHARRESVPIRDVRPDLPGRFARIVERALAHVAEDRYRTAGELEKSLQAYQDPVSRREPAPSLPHEEKVGGSVAGAESRLRAGSGSADVPHPRDGSWWVRAWKEHPLGAAVSGTAILLVVGGLAVVAGLRVRGVADGTGTAVAPTGPRPELSAAQSLGAVQIEAALFLAASGGPQRLHTGDTVRPGDQLFLQLGTTRALHVYVLSEDARGHSTVIFPLEFLDERNPLPPGEAHRLPGSVGGAPYFWDVASGGGIESIYVIAAAAPLADLEAALEMTPRATKESDHQDSREPDRGGTARPVESEKADKERSLDVQALAAELRGITSASPSSHGQDAPPQLRRLGGLFESISRDAAARSGIWTWQIVLQNTGE